MEFGLFFICLWWGRRCVSSDSVAMTESLLYDLMKHLHAYIKLLVNKGDQPTIAKGLMQPCISDPRYSKLFLISVILCHLTH